jgi:hypothetical protein
LSFLSASGLVQEKSGKLKVFGDPHLQGGATSSPDFGLVRGLSLAVSLVSE